MTNRIPVKAIYSGSNVTALGEFVTNDTISTVYTDAKITSVAGQTGAISNAQLLAGVQETGIFTTANVTELSNLYFSNARVYSNVLQLNYATVSYVDQAVANVIDAAPGVLDTLNEIAAAINDDPSFFANVALAGGIAYDQANAAYNRANVAVTFAGSAFDKANTLVATVAGVSSTLISNTNLLDGIKTVDGSGSGLDADSLDGQDGSYYLDWTNTTNKPNPVVTVSMTGDVTGSASTTLDSLNSNTITISTTIAANSVALGSDTTGDYIQNVIPGAGIVITGTPGESRDATIALDSSGVSASIYGGATKVPVLTVDQYGRITSASNVSVAGVANFTASGNTFTISTADGGTFNASIQHDSVRLGTDTTGAYVSNLIAGTGVTINGLGNEGTTPTISIGQAVETTSDVIFRDLTVTGNVFLTGTAFYANANILVVEDSLVQYAFGNPGDAFDIGFVGHYLDGSTQRHAGLFRDATDKTFKFFANVTAEPTANVIDISDSSFQLANVQAGYFIGDASTLNNVNASNISHGTLDSARLPTSGVVASTYGAAGVQAVFSVDSSGRITSASNVTTTTANVAENSNLYFTNARVVTAVQNNAINNANIGNLVANYTLTVGNPSTSGYRFPEQDGIALQILQTDGNGQLNFVNLDQASGGGYTVSTLVDFPGSDGNVDYGEGEGFVGASVTGLSDAFGVSLGAVYDNMEPIGRMVEEDLEAA